MRSVRRGARVPEYHGARGIVFVAVALLVLGVLATGCFNPFDPRVATTTGFSTKPPDPLSPVGVLRLYEWCWNKRDPDLYREIFSDDYQFRFALADSAGNAYRDRALTREEELDIATNIFVRGTASEPPPVSISLTFSGNLFALADSRHDATGHVRDGHLYKEIAAQTLLRIDQPDYQVTGVTRFFCVRGDVALLPKDLTDRNFKPDSTRWYIDEIDDETLPGSLASRVPPATRSRRGAAATALEPGPFAMSLGRLLTLWDGTRSSR